MGRMVVHFAGEGSGVAELSWGQLEILGAMRRQRTWMPLPVTQSLRAGTTVDDVADWLRYLMDRHQVLRTKLQLYVDGPPRQVLYASGNIAMDVVEAGDEDPAGVAQRMFTRYEQFVEHEFNFARDWPILLAVILKDGVPVYRVLTVCHIVWDAFGGLAMLADLQRRDAAGGASPKPNTAMQALEQARWQRSAAGQRHNENVLAHWAQLLRQIPARRFPAPVDRGQPRHWLLELVSPAIHLAIQVIRYRTGASSTQVILTLFLVALARVTGVDLPVARVAVNNRFRRGLADSVSVTTQYGLCVVDVAGVPFDEALARVSRRVIATFKNAYYDPRRVAELVERIGRERGEELDIHCYYNDRRLSQEDKPVDDPPAPAQVREARSATTVSQQPLIHRGSERLFAAVEERPGSFRMTLEADTWHMSREAMVAWTRAMEEAAVEAALDQGSPAPDALGAPPPTTGPGTGTAAVRDGRGVSVAAILANPRYTGWDLDRQHIDQNEAVAGDKATSRGSAYRWNPQDAVPTPPDRADPRVSAPAPSRGSSVPAAHRRRAGARPISRRYRADRGGCARNGAARHTRTRGDQ